MKPTDNIERLMQSLRLSTTRTLDDRVLTDSTEALAMARHEQPPTGRILRIGRFLMQNQYARFAAAAIVIAAVGYGLASLTVLDNGVGRAYAFEQTVQAMHSVRSLHIKNTGGQMAESWSEFDADGQVVRCRMDFPRTEDGHKVVFWQDNKASVWFKTKGSYLTIADHKVAQRTLEMARENDPKLMVSRLQEAGARGEVQIETQAQTGKPIVLTVTYLPGSKEPDRRQVLWIDPATRLVTHIENYRKVDEQYKLRNQIEILEYNQPIDPAIFKPQLPDDVMRIDQTTQVIGLAQGQMTDVQVAKEVVRQFFQALIDKDYAKAGQLFSGMPASKIEQAFGKFPIVRIVTVGEPFPDVLRSRGLRVPVTVEIEQDGQKHEWSREGVFVRPVEGQPDRWNIHGGI